MRDGAGEMVCGGGDVEGVRCGGEGVDADEL